MSGPSIWEVLGVEPTADRASIRRAYAQELRRTSPEDDPQGFLRLREAYELALAIEAGREGGADLMVLDAPTPDTAQPAREPHAVEEPPSPAPARREIEQVADALIAILQSEDEAGIEAAVPLQQAFIDHPALEDLGERASAEAWLAHQLAIAIPRSDPLLQPAIDGFGWTDTNYRAPSDVVAAVLQRNRERLREVSAISRYAVPGEPAHAAWRALRAEKRPNWRRRIDALRPKLRTRVSELLDEAGTAPRLKSQLSQKAVDWWTWRLTRKPVDDVRAHTPIFWLLALGVLAWAAPRASMATSAVAATVLGVVAATGFVLWVRPRVRAWSQARVEQSGPWLLGAWIIAAGVLCLPPNIYGAAGAGLIAVAALLWRAGLSTYAEPRSPPRFWDWLESYAPLGACSVALLVQGREADVGLMLLAATPLLLLWWPDGRTLATLAEGSSRPRIALLGVAAVVIFLRCTSPTFGAGGDSYRGAVAALTLCGLYGLAVRLEAPRIAGHLRAVRWVVYPVVFIACLGASAPWMRASKPAPASSASRTAPMLHDEPIASCPTATFRDPGSPPRLCTGAPMMTSDDYPVDALLKNLGGKVEVWLLVDATGRVAQCDVTVSSGVPSLDSTACRLFKSRARFLPAVDKKGRPAMGTVSTAVVWKPEELAPERPAG